ncbi:MAG: hypothetical protein NC218_08080 [Acetobacter sp.]|nr:hypothetical protein [Acetobacter sp.]
MTTTSKREQRKSVPDDLITDEMITEIVNMVFNKLDDVYNPSQKRIVEILMGTKLSYATIARVVKEILPQANPTKNSIRSLINHIKTQDEVMDGFLEELRRDINGTD